MIDSWHTARHAPVILQELGLKRRIFVFLRFIDLQNVYDSVDRKLPWDMLTRVGVPRQDDRGHPTVPRRHVLMRAVGPRGSKSDWFLATRILVESSKDELAAPHRHAQKQNQTLQRQAIEATTARAFSEQKWAQARVRPRQDPEQCNRIYSKPSTHRRSGASKRKPVATWYPRGWWSRSSTVRLGLHA